MIYREIVHKQTQTSNLVAWSYLMGILMKLIENTYLSPQGFYGLSTELLG